MSKSVILKDETANLLNRVKGKLLNLNTGERVTDELAVRRACEAYLQNGN